MSASSTDFSSRAAAGELHQPSELREIAGPSALGGSPRRFVFLTFTLALTEFKLRFYGSVLGYVWQLVRPLLLFATLYIVFHHVVKIGGTVPFFPVILLTNIMLFTYFGEAASAVTSVVDHEQLMRKVQVPRMAIPLAQTLTATFNVALNFVVIVIFAVISDAHITWRWIEIPVLIGLLGLLAAGFAMLVSALYVRYRDVKPIWDVFMQMLFYATPVIYVLETLDIDQSIKEAMALNPLAAILIQMRHAMFDPSAPTAADAVGGVPYLLIPIGILVAIVAAGYVVFNREAPRIAEEL